MPESVCESFECEGGIVVGVDGSESSIHALHLAADEARCRQAVLHVLCAWSVRAVPRPVDCPPGQVPSMLEYEQEVQRRITARVTRELGDQPPFKVEIHVVHAPPNQALVQASRFADLLVVGHRGRGTIRELMLGSVAEQCVRSAQCPVLVARPRDAGQTLDAGQTNAPEAAGQMRQPDSA
jgi:nucleotide-binding universal stress UspA family protein